MTTANFWRVVNQLNWIRVRGNHQTFSIEKDLCDDNHLDRLKGNIEDIAQWVIWKKIDRPDFNTCYLDCDWFYNQNIEIIKEIKREVNKINHIVDDIIRNIPDEYKHEIKEKLRI